jgi:hypothetical protein
MAAATLSNHFFYGDLRSGENCYGEKQRSHIRIDSFGDVARQL